MKLYYGIPWKVRYFHILVHCCFRHFLSITLIFKCHSTKPNVMCSYNFLTIVIARIAWFSFIALYASSLFLLLSSMSKDTPLFNRTVYEQNFVTQTTLRGPMWPPWYNRYNVCLYVCDNTCLSRKKYHYIQTFFIQCKNGSS